MCSHCAIAHSFKIEIIGIGDAIRNPATQIAAKPKIKGNGVGVLPVKMNGVVLIGKPGQHMFIKDHKAHINTPVFSCRKILSGKAKIGQHMVVQPMSHLKERDQPASMQGEFCGQATLSEKGIIEPKGKMMHRRSQVPVYFPVWQFPVMAPDQSA